MRAKIGSLIVFSLLLSPGCKSVDVGSRSTISEVSPAASTDVVAAWTQLGPDNDLLVRVITSARSCPALTVDGASIALRQRFQPEADFSITVCETTVQPTAHVMSLGSKLLPMPKANPSRIVVFGDTGCRMKKAGGNFNFQGCDVNHWPLEQLARTMAALEPDLAIHVGDYHYREAPCPGSRQDCSQDVAGDNWISWQQDVITPLIPLFNAVPLVLARGNHELCARGGNGWFHLLDPRPMPAACTDKTPAYWISVGDHRYGLMDSAIDSNHQPSLDQLAAAATTNSLVWLITHRPFLTPGADDETTVPPPTLPTAFAGAGKVGVVLTGHQHRLSLNTFSDERPPELVSGNGGTMLDPPLVAGNIFTTLDGSGFQALEWFDFGFLLFERQDTGVWAVSEYDRKGDVIFKCDMQEAIGQRTKFFCTTTP